VQAAKSSYIPIVALVVIYLFLGMFLFSYENYPIDDDWSYIKAAETFHTTGEMKFTPWTAMSLVFQVWWGTSFTKLFGYSIEILRVSTLTISLLGLIFIYLLFRELGYNWQTGFLSVLLILFNPFSFPLNFTFFTDQFYISLIFIAVYFYYKAFKDNRDSYAFIASLIASASILVRQNGILLPLSVLIYLVLRERSFRGIAIRAVVSIAMPIITLVAFTYWFNMIHGPTSEYTRQAGEIVGNITKPHLFLIKMIWRPILILEFVGFCLLPLSFSFLPGLKELFQRKHYFLLLLFCTAGTVFFLLFEHIGLYPSVDLWLNGFRFAHISEYGYRDAMNLLFFFYRSVDFLSVASVVYLIYLVIKYWQVVTSKFSFASPSFLIIFIGIFQFLFLLLTLYKFSRYYLTLIPFFVMVVLAITRQVRINRVVFILLLACYSLFSLAVTQDVMSWNQVKWQSAQKLLDKGVSPRKISAGFAWDAWHSCQYSLDNPFEIASQRGDVPWWIEKLVPAIDPHYIISSSPIPTGFETFSYFDADRYNVVDSFGYSSRFYFKEMKLYLLERVPRTDQAETGWTAFNFLANLKGASVEGVGTLEELEVTLNGITKSAWMQPSPSEVTFRMQLPHGRCRFRLSLGMMPSCWDKSGDGALCKITINDILLENFFGVPGAVGLGQVKQFFRPRTYFLPSRTYYIQFINPENPAEKKWQEVFCDLSSFSGRVVDITFQVTGGPRNDDNCDEVLWGEPAIESF